MRMRKRNLNVLGGLLLVCSTAGAQVTLSDPAGSYTTIQDAVNAANANATITVDGSTYNGTEETVVINVAGITLEGINGAIVENPGDDADTGAATEGVAVILVDRVADVTVRDLTVNVDEPEASAGIVFRGQNSAELGSPVITDNTVTTTGPSASSDPLVNFFNVDSLVPFPNAGYGSAAGISVFTVAGTGVTDITMQGNTVGTLANPFSLAGIFIERGGGTIGGVSPAEGNIAYSENFALIIRFTSLATTISNNQFFAWGDERNRGAGVELGDVQTFGDIVFDSNTVTLLDGRSPQGFIPRRAMQIKNCYNSTEIELTNNTFNINRDETVGATEGLSGTGLAITNVRRAFVGFNDFNALEDDVLLLEINNKIYSSGDPFQNAGDETNRPRVFGNTFDAPVSSTGVTAISVRDHSQENGGSGVKIEVQDVVVGNPAAPNEFGADLETFIELSDLSGTTDTALDIYGNQAGESNLRVTTATPFTGNFFADQNRYDAGTGLLFPFQMDSGELATVNGKVTDNADNASLGVVVTLRTPDSDADDVPDSLEAELGTDGVAGKDFDNDGVEDGVEIQIGTDPAVADAFSDADGDGLPDSFDPTVYNAGNELTGGTPSDFDGDGTPDFYEVLYGSNPEDATQKPLLGDVDGNLDGVGFTDGIRMLRVFLGLESLGDLDNPALFDVNRDGVNDNVDGVITINFFLGNIDELPFGG